MTFAGVFQLDGSRRVSDSVRGQSGLREHPRHTERRGVSQVSERRGARGVRGRGGESGETGECLR